MFYSFKSKTGTFSIEPDETCDGMFKLFIGRAIRFSTFSFVTMAVSGIFRADLSSLIRGTEDSILISGSL